MNALSLERVSKQYAEKTAVNQISFDVQKGEIYGLLGANGAGKTTTMRMILGLIYPDDGTILYEGKPYSKELLRKVGYLPEERGLYPKIKVADQLIYLAQLKGMTKKEADKNLKQWLERFQIPDYYHMKVEELSKGNQQKVQFISAIIHNPDLLIMDEAFSGLDPVNVELLKETVKELRDAGKSIVFSTHRMEHVEELCNHITVLHRSNTVLQGNIRQIKSEFPKERVKLNTAGNVDGLENIPGVEKVKTQANGYDIKISSLEAAQGILQTALGQSIVHKFEIMEPTLNEIFIKTVGGDLHEQ